MKGNSRRPHSPAGLSKFPFCGERLGARLGACFRWEGQRRRGGLRECLTGTRAEHVFQRALRLFEEFVRVTVALLGVPEVSAQCSELVREFLQLFLHSQETFH